ncbi:MAG: DNA repair protein RecN [Dehalococcoidia bacterium]|nr:DNA repair protein RecN [Dehalococcoidia bacterium]
MLLELNVTNFAIIDRLSTQFRRGFNTLTGETGAGKSIIIDALGAVLGGRTGPEVIRTGCEMARIEALFDTARLDESVRSELRDLFIENGIEMEETLVLSREISRSRSVCRINGRATPASFLGRVGQLLVDIHGQSDHLSLLRPAEHIRFLDRYAGLTDQRQSVANTVKNLRSIRRELDDMAKSDRESARRLDLLDYQIKEIEAAKARPGEEEELQAEHRLLANAEMLSAHSTSAYSLLYDGGAGSLSALDGLSRALVDINELGRLDPTFKEQRELAESISYQLEDLASALRAYRDNIEFNPNRMAAIEERLESFRNLKRKYGGSIEEVLAFVERAKRDMSAITHRDERIGDLRQEEVVLRQELGLVASQLSLMRQEAAELLAREIEKEIQGLSMPKARFVVSIVQVDQPDGVPFKGRDQEGHMAGDRQVAFDESGIDRIEFLIAPNPGEALKPLVKIASGGETSRIMLAMKTVLSKADPVSTLVFDEVEVGVGGRSGHLVGQKLWNLTRSHQVICITHSPQVAAFGDVHFRVHKEMLADRTLTQLQELALSERIVEIAQMLGSDTESTRKSAEEMISLAAAVKLREQVPT